MIHSQALRRPHFVCVRLWSIGGYFSTTGGYFLDNIRGFCIIALYFPIFPC
jgi:hypothetical protein